MLVRILLRIDAPNFDDLPRSGPYIFTINHLNLLDPPVIFALLGDRNATGWAGSTHRENPLYRLVVEMAGGIWIRRGEADRAALNAALAKLKEGWIFGVSPEGTRSETHALIEGKEGTAFLAYRSGVLVYPLAIWGTEKASASWKRLRRPTIHMRLGEPFRLADVPVAERSERLQVWTTEIMCRIAALLPPEYHGVYADHPRLQALLTEDEARVPIP